MAKTKSPWLTTVPAGMLSKLSLEELRAFNGTHEFLTEPIQGPEGIAYHIRGYRYLLFFAIACIAENKYPRLTRCWKQLDRLFMRSPPFDDDLFVQAWILFDFPFGPKGETALDYFEAFLAGSEGGTQFQYFIDEARKSRLGLYEDVMRTKNVSKVRELFTGCTVSAVRSVEEYGRGEIWVVRMIEYRGEVFLFGDPKGWPKETKRKLQNMVADKFFYFPGDTDVERYTNFMKLAGPYWMSCVTKDESVPILDPDHYQTYLDEGPS